MIDTNHEMRSGYSRFGARFLYANEREKLVVLSRKDAIAKRDAGTRPKVYTEIDHALQILSESSSEELTLEDVRRVWVTLDHHESAELSDLPLHEKGLAEVGRFGDS